MSLTNSIIEGNIDIVMAEYNNGIIIDHDTALTSVIHGHVELTRILIDMCGVNYDPCAFTISLRHTVELAELLYDRGVRIDKTSIGDIKYAYKVAIDNSIDMVKFLYKKGYYPKSNALSYAVSKSADSEIVKYLYNIGCEASQSTLLNAIDMKSYWLIERISREEIIYVTSIVERVIKKAMLSCDGEICCIIHDATTTNWHLIYPSHKCRYCMIRIVKEMMKIEENSMFSWLTTSNIDSLYD